MLSVLLAVVAAACFVFMIVAVLVAIRLADRLERAENRIAELEKKQPSRRDAHLVGVPSDDA
jgi:hypothetical protein